MTPVNLAPIKHRLSAAQVGDWPHMLHVHGPSWLLNMLRMSSATRAFVVNAPRDMAALIREVESLRRQVEGSNVVAMPPRSPGAA